jgi:negative regulator of sigma E activity
MSTGLPQASVKSQIFESLLGFLPDWVQITVLALIVLAVVASWVVKIKRKIAYRRALRNGHPVHAAAQYGQRRGADYLGQYATQQTQQTQQTQPAQQQGSGADHLGAYAPQQRAEPARQPSGADFLGAYAPQQRQGENPSANASA